MRNMDIPQALMTDAENMFQALLSDLREMENIEIMSTRDDRFPGIPESVLNICSGDDIWDIWRKIMQPADAVWLIAPETGNSLEKLIGVGRDAGCTHIGCSTEAVRLAGSKIRTAECLNKLGISCIDTCFLHETIPASDTGWVIKPDDGVASEHCYYFEDFKKLQSWRENQNINRLFVIQPYIQGEPVSLSVVFHAHGSTLLSFNRQLFKFKDGIAINDGIIVNADSSDTFLYQSIVDRIADGIPGLNGYVGIDLILSASGPVVVEINPRLTSSYAGLSQALGINTAQYILQLVMKNGLEPPDKQSLENNAVRLLYQHVN